MTPTLATLVEKLEALPTDEQETWINFLLAEMESEARWDSRFEQSQDMLDQLGAEALAELRAGKTLPVERSER